MSWLLRSAAIGLLTLAPPPRVSALLRMTPHAVATSTPASRRAGKDGERSRVVVLGGGFGGLYTTLRLAEYAQLPSSAGIDVTLVDSRDRFCFLPLLYELALGQATEAEVAPRFEQLLANRSGAAFRQARVAGVDTDRKVVLLDEDGEELPYDRLVVALGGEPTNSVVPGTDEHGMAFYTVEDAHRLQRELARLDQLPSDTPVRVVVIGGSYSGVELACSLVPRLAETRGRDNVEVVLVERGAELLAQSPEHNRNTAQAALDAAGVQVRCATSVLRVSADAVAVSAGSAEETLPADLTVWTAGSRPKALDGEGLCANARDDAGRIMVDSALRVMRTDAVYALGDNALLPSPLPPSAQVAFQQSEYAAWNVWASLNGDKQLAFQYTALGEMLTLGGSDATVAGPAGLDALRLSGPVAGAARRFVYAARMPTNEQRVAAGLGWLQTEGQRARQRLAKRLQGLGDAVVRSK